VRSAALGGALVGGRAEIDHAMVYLEWVVQQSSGLRSRDKSVHNFLLYLYAKQPVEDMLLRYVTASVAGMAAAAAEGRRALLVTPLQSVIDPSVSREEGALSEVPLFDVQVSGWGFQ
jgi:hypothetical protein